MVIRIVPINDTYRNQVIDLIAENWGSAVVITRGRIHNAESLPGFVALVNGEIQGIITYHIENGQCEIVSLDSLLEKQGIGSSLIKKVVDTARKALCSRVWLITSNDNTHAIRFYQRVGFDLVAVYRNAVDESRKIKPQIPLRGFDDIPIKHEIEFEILI